MYIQITTRCNMACEHCGYDCGVDGDDMDIETFKAAIKYDDDTICIGGGEPTIHPKFWEFIGLALRSNAEYIWLATNGKKTDTALALAGLAKRGAIGCALSLDNYHDPIDDKVVEAFKATKHILGIGDMDSREIRNVTSKEINSGRCDFGTEGCICEDLVCEPNGNVKACGCQDAPLFGNINGKVVIPDDYNRECFKLDLSMRRALEVFNNG
ncbi:hypothetical protein LCGC14_0873350 [marine sediment metagenome]|uniref:Radical SAM core domain-containing protein n=1 Tax=marine sediment metagenome TaxID=412755 RepID=A0A0F9PPQ3_9ZZZZ